MISEQAFIGGATAVLCATGIWHQAWLLEHTKKGRKLVRWFGDEPAQWVLRLLLVFGLGFGVLLAAGVLNPVRWDRPLRTSTAH